MTTRPDGGAAFPRSVSVEGPDSLKAEVFNNGMSLRDYFAAKALQGFAANQHVLYRANNIASECGTNDEHELAEMAYDLADAMLRARAAQSPVDTQAAHLDTFGR